jgi:hypothetical protein
MIGETIGHLGWNAGCVIAVNTSDRSDFTLETDSPMVECGNPMMRESIECRI